MLYIRFQESYERTRIPAPPESSAWRPPDMPYQGSSFILQPVSAWSEPQQVLKTAFDKVTLSRPNPLKSFREFEDLRHRIVHEAGVGKLGRDVDCKPFKTTHDLNEYIYAMAKEVKMQRLSRLLKDTPSSELIEVRIQCPLLTFNPLTGETIQCETTNARDKDILQRHILTHTERPKLCCPYPECNLRTYQRENMKQHIRAMHLNARKECSHKGCSKTFTQDASLTRHARKDHGVPPRATKRGDNWLRTLQKSSQNNQEKSSRKPKGGSKRKIVKTEVKSR